MAREYWATKEPMDLAREIMARVEGYYRFVESEGWLNIWRRLQRQYYAGFFTGATIGREGKQAELSKLYSNQFGSLLQRMHTMTASQKLSLEARAQNTDYKAQARTVIANGVLEHCQEEKRFNAHALDVLETGDVLGESELLLGWNQDAGKVVGIDENTGRPARAGDLELTPLGPLDLIRDVHRAQARGHAWKIARTSANKWELAARMEGTDAELAARITEIEPDYDDDSCPRLTERKADDFEGDDIPVYVFQHDRTAALPDGRLVILVSSDCVIAEGPLPYQEISSYRYAAGNVADTPFGYSVSFDLLGLQQALDGLASIILTNQSTFGIQNVWMPPGSSVTPSKLIPGLNEFSGPVKPEALQLTSSPAEIFKFMDLIVLWMETLSGVNSVARGNPEASLKSGAALALVAAQAVEFAARRNAAFSEFLSTAARGVLRIERDFRTVPTKISVAGKTNRPYAKEFTGQDLDGIDRVYVDMGNPMTRTAAGRVEIANTLLAAVDPGTGKPMIENGQQYLQVIATGKLEPLTEGPTSKLMYIRAENERLMEGQDVMGLATDDDACHVPEHETVLHSPEARENPEVVEATLAHIDWHIQNAMTKDPNLAMMLKQFVPPPPMPIGPANEPMPPGEMAPANAPMADPMAEGQSPELPAPAEPPPLPVAS